MNKKTKGLIEILVGAAMLIGIKFYKDKKSSKYAEVNTATNPDPEPVDSEAEKTTEE